MAISLHDGGTVGGAIGPQSALVLQTAFGPADQQSEERAVRIAKGLAAKEAGVIAWSRVADMALGGYGEPTVLFTAGEVPEME